MKKGVEEEKKPRVLNFTVGKYLLCALIALGVSAFGIIISLPPTDVSFYAWYPKYKQSLSGFQDSLFDSVVFNNNIQVAKDTSLKPIEQKLQDDHRVDIFLPKRWKSELITAGSEFNLMINQQSEPIVTKLVCNSLILNYTIDENSLAADGKNFLRVYSLSNLQVPCEFLSKYGLSNYILIEQDPLILLGQQTNWSLEFFSMSEFPSWLRTLSLAFLTFPGLTIMYGCSLCFYKKYRYRYKVINGLLKHEASI